MKLFIPWRLLYNALSRQPVNERLAWLELFKFNDGGVEAIQVVVFTGSAEPQNKGLSEFERAVLSAIAEPKRRTFLH